MTLRDRFTKVLHNNETPMMYLWFYDWPHVFVGVSSFQLINWGGPDSENQRQLIAEKANSQVVFLVGISQKQDVFHLKNHCLFVFFFPFRFCFCSHAKDQWKAFWRAQINFNNNYTWV